MCSCRCKEDGSAQACSMHPTILSERSAMKTSHSGVICSAAQRSVPLGAKSPVPQALVWTLTAVLSLLIVASRKHYSVDVVVAWYAVPLVFWMMHRRWTTKRPPTDEWPHRPLIPHETELAEVLVQQADAVRPCLCSARHTARQTEGGRGL